MADEPIWLTIEDVDDIHAGQIAAFGGLLGIKDEGLIQSALHSPVHHWLYLGVTDVLALGIRLCVAIARDHGYLDGNKRTATAAMIEFFYINGYWLNVPDENAVHPLLGTLVEQSLLGEIDERQLYDVLAPFFIRLDR